MDRDDWLWDLAVDDHEIALEHATNPFTVHLRAGEDTLMLKHLDRSWSLSADDLEPAGRDQVEFDAADKVRSELLGGVPGGAVVGGWSLYESGNIFAFRHRDWNIAVAGDRRSNGWLVVIDSDSVGFLHTHELAEPRA